MVTIIIDENTLKTISITAILLIYFILTGYIWYLKIELIDLQNTNDFLKQSIEYYQTVIDKLHQKKKIKNTKKE